MDAEGVVKGSMEWEIIPKNQEKNTQNVRVVGDVE